MPMERRPSEQCEDCIWWHEEPLLCKGCPNNPETADTPKSHLNETSTVLKKKLLPPRN